MFSDPITWVTLVYAVTTIFLLSSYRQTVKLMRSQTEQMDRALQSDMIFKFLSEYFSDEMLDALRTLADWRNRHGEAFADIWYLEFKEGSETGIAVDKARRRLKQYFKKAHRLRSHGYVNQQAFYAIAYNAGLNLLYDVADPLEVKLNPDRSDLAGPMLQLLGRYEHLPPETSVLIPGRA